MSEESEEPDDKIDLDNVGTARDKLYSDVMETNMAMWKQARRQAKAAIKRAERYEYIAYQERQIAAIHVVTATQLSELLGDTVVGELDFQVVKMEEGEGPDDVNEDAE